MASIESLQVAVALAAVLVALALALWKSLSASSKPFLDAAEWKPLRLAERKDLTHNTRLFRFALSHPTQLLGLPTGHHITLKTTLPSTGEEAMRPYTPVTDDFTRGVVDFVIKVYPTGRVTPALDALRVGDTVLAKGPKGRFTYERNMADEIGLVAGGTGITPMFAVAMAALRDRADTTKFSLVFGNVTEDDILIRDLLEDLAGKNPGRFKVHHVLNDPPPSREWDGSIGFITREILKRHLPAPGPRTLVLRCGPGPMNRAVGGALEELGYTKEMTFEF